MIFKKKKERKQDIKVVKAPLEKTKFLIIKDGVVVAEIKADIREEMNKVIEEVKKHNADTWKSNSINAWGGTGNINNKRKKL